MKRTLLTVTLTIAIGGAVTIFVAAQPKSAKVAAPAAGWACFRGPDRTGIAPPGNDSVPLQWSDSIGIIWKTSLPGRGASSPVVWGENIYLTAYSGHFVERQDRHSNITNLMRHLLCVDATKGEVRWKTDIATGKIHEHGLSEFGYLHGHASSTPAVDASGVYCYLGRAGIFAFDHSGKQRWHTPTGEHQHNWGTASSPVLFENLVIVHADQESNAVVALDKQTGREVWRTPTGTGDSWSTPLVVNTGGQPALVFHHSNAHNMKDGKGASAGAVDARTGEALWNCRILSDYLCPSPVAKDGVIYWLAYNSAAAVRAGGKGDVTGSHVLWTSKHGSEVGTPVLHDGHLYWAHEESGMAYCVDAKTGARVWRERLEPKPGRIYASGVLAGGRLYFVSRENGTYVVEAKPVFRQLAHNVIASDTGIFNGSPAISGGRIFLRSDRFLYCIGAR